MNKKMLKLLYKSFDTNLTAPEQEALDKALNQSRELQEQKKKLLAIRTNLKKH